MSRRYRLLPDRSPCRHVTHEQARFFEQALARAAVLEHDRFGVGFELARFLLGQRAAGVDHHARRAELRLLAQRLQHAKAIHVG